MTIFPISQNFFCYIHQLFEQDIGTLKRSLSTKSRRFSRISEIALVRMKNFLWGHSYRMRCQDEALVPFLCCVHIQVFFFFTFIFIYLYVANLTCCKSRSFCWTKNPNSAITKRLKFPGRKICYDLKAVKSC